MGLSHPIETGSDEAAISAVVQASAFAIEASRAVFAAEVMAWGMLQAHPDIAHPKAEATRMGMGSMAVFVAMPPAGACDAVGERDMSYAIQAWYSYSTGTFGTPQNGLLRDPIRGRIIVYETREEAQSWIDAADTMGYRRAQGEMSPPIYRIRKVDHLPPSSITRQRYHPYHARVAAAAVDAWDHERVEDLLQALAALREACEMANQEHIPCYPENLVDMAALPTEDFPDSLSLANVWALDKQGMALVGALADRIMPLGELMELEAAPR